MNSTARNEPPTERNLFFAYRAISSADLGGGLGGQTCSRCVHFILPTATFSRRRLEVLLPRSGKSRHCLDNPKTPTLSFPPPPHSRCHGRITHGYSRCAIRMPANFTKLKRFAAVGQTGNSIA